MSVKIIVDPGSCHLGSVNKTYHLIEHAKDAGADAIKFQLFKEEVPFVPPNIMLPWDWFPKLVEYGNNIGIEVFASFFHWDAYKVIRDAGCKSIKFAYGMRGQVQSYWLSGVLAQFDTAYVSNDFMEWHPTKIADTKIKRLWCIPQYPVPFQVDFTDKFKRFDGFSSHCMGTQQELMAMRAGAKIIELHMKLPGQTNECPDALISKTPEEVTRLCVWRDMV